MRAIDFNGHVPDADGTADVGPAERIAAAAEGAAATMAALEQTARDALARLDAILARLG